MAMLLASTFSSMEHLQDDMDTMSDVDNIDVDFEIDYDTKLPSQDLQHADEMQDDLPATRELVDIELQSVATQDDYMLDDANQPPDQEQDGMMTDGEIKGDADDEELLDFSEDEIDDVAESNLGEGRTLEHPDALAREGSDETVVDAREDAHVPHGSLEDVAQDVTLAPNGDECSTNTEGPYDDRDSNEQTVGQSRDETVMGLEKGRLSPQQAPNDEIIFSAEPAAHEAGGTEDFNEVVDGVHEDDHHELKDTPVVTREFAHDSPGSGISEGQQTVTGMHTTLVKYLDGTYTMFPSSEPVGGEEYFLQDENLVSGSIGDLLQACRNTLGEAIKEDEELEMYVDELDLCIAEDSTAAFSTSFSELLDLYLTLCRNDSDEAPPPFGVTLSTRARFPNRLALLHIAASQGKGLSSVIEEHYVEGVDAQTTTNPEHEGDAAEHDYATPIGIDEAEHIIDVTTDFPAARISTLHSMPGPNTAVDAHESTISDNGALDHGEHTHESLTTDGETALLVDDTLNLIPKTADTLAATIYGDTVEPEEHTDTSPEPAAEVATNGNHDAQQQTLTADAERRDESPLQQDSVAAVEEEVVERTVQELGEENPDKIHEHDDQEVQYSAGQPTQDSIPAEISYDLSGDADDDDLDEIDYEDPVEEHDATNVATSKSMRVTSEDASAPAGLKRNADELLEADDAEHQNRIQDPKRARAS